jgi:hypothetical protein
MFRKDKQKEIAESISQSRLGREVSQQEKRNLHLATRRPA